MNIKSNGKSRLRPLQQRLMAQTCIKISQFWVDGMGG
jgi:hypothetical protein